MSTIKGPAIETGDVRVGYTSSTWRFLNEEDSLKEQTYGKLIQQYGNGLRLFDAWMWAGRSIDISTRDIMAITEGHFWDTIDLASPIAANNIGDDITIVSLKAIGRVGFVVHIPARYCAGTNISQSYRIQTRTYAAPNYTYVCSPLLATQQIDVQVPTAQKLIVGGSMFAPGTGQPAGLVKDFWHDHFNTRILKETFHEEGGQIALEERDDLKNSLYGGSVHARNLITTQLQLRHQINDAVLMGYPNTNSLQQANKWGELNDISGFYGLIPTMYNDAMKQYYTATYTEDNFDILKFLFASQGLSGTTGLFLLGQELGLSIENSGLTFLKEYSGGTDLYDKLQGIGFAIKEVFKNNFKTRLVEIPEFNNPITYAADGYNFESMGMIFPDSKVTAVLNGMNAGGVAQAGKKVSLDHMTLGYMNYGGENRKLIVANQAGVNGLGITTSDDWDTMSTYMLCEMMVILVAMNQTILVLRTDA